MPVDFDSPHDFDPRLQRELADWLVHVKARRDPARDDADTESDPVLFEEEDYEVFVSYAVEHLGEPGNDDLRDTLEAALGFSAWTSAI